MSKTVGLTLVTACAASWYWKDNAIGSGPRYSKEKVRFWNHSVPLLGCFPWLLTHLTEFDDATVQFCQGDESPFVLSIPFTPTIVVITDSKSFQHIMSTNFDNYLKGPVFYTNFTGAFGNGIFNADGETWYWQRKLASKVFTTKSFKTNFETVFQDNINILTSVLAERAQKQEMVDMHDLFYRFFIDSFGSIAFGTDLQSLKFKDLPFVLAFDNAQLQISEMMINPILSFRNRYFGGRYRNDVKTIREFGLQVVRQRKDQGNQNQDKRDLLSLFMEFTNDEGEPLTEEQLVDQVINFIIAGRDTTAQALSWTFYDLATRPEIAEKICEEAKSIMGDSLIPTYDQVREMKYAKAVFLESLRLHPSVRRDGKQAVNDDILPNGTHIKKGTFVVWNNYAMGRNENIWKDAAKYDPERFMEGKTYSQFDYPAFNAGPRVCLGKTLAELQGVFAMVCILVQFKISPVDLTGVDFLFSLTNPMKNGLWSKVESRTEI